MKRLSAQLADERAAAAAARLGAASREGDARRAKDAAEAARHGALEATEALAASRLESAARTDELEDVRRRLSSAVEKVGSEERKAAAHAREAAGLRAKLESAGRACGGWAYGAGPQQPPTAAVGLSDEAAVQRVAEMLVAELAGSAAGGSPGRRTRAQKQLLRGLHPDRCPARRVATSLTQELQRMPGWLRSGAGTGTRGGA